MIAILIYEMNTIKVNRKRALIYSLLIAITISVPTLPRFKIPVLFEATTLDLYSILIYLVVQIRSPIWMILCFIITVSVLKLPIRNILNQVVVIFCVYQILICFEIASEIIFWEILFSNGANLINRYILEELMTFFITLIFIIIYTYIYRYIRTNENRIKMFSEEYTSPPTKLVIIQSFQITFLWIIATAGIFTGVSDNQYIIIVQVAYATVMVIIHVLIIYFNFTIKLRNIQTKYLMKSNKMMLETIDNFQGIRHDFNNILQTYDGYFLLGDFEGLKKYHQILRNKTIFAGERLNFQSTFNDKPAILGLFSNTIDYAERLDVSFDFLHAEILNHVAILEFDLCRILGILFNNAIEHAAQTKTKVVSFSAQFQPNNKCIIIISNSVDEKISSTELFKVGFTTKEGHLGQGLPEVNKILAKYHRCTIMQNCTEDTFTMYLSAATMYSDAKKI